MARALLLVVLVPLAACLKPPSNLAGRFDEVTVHDAQTAAHDGAAVRWGGTLVSMQPAQGRTCFEIAGFPLDGQARPRHVDESAGRFIACNPQFYEPSVYTQGRDVTVVGALNGTISGKVGQYDYRFPRVDAATIYLWPERQGESAAPTWWPSVSIGVGGGF
jgi:outer membrane lipoprotein